MTVQGHIKNGAIVPDVPIMLPEGAQVQIEVVSSSGTTNDRETQQAPTLYERLKPFVGSLDGLPEDAAQNLKHYLYGHPKRA
jgi:hypothetical protein